MRGVLSVANAVDRFSCCQAKPIKDCVIGATAMSDDDICDACGFPKEAKRTTIFMKSSKFSLAMHLASKCPECGHYEDGSTIVDDGIRTRYGGPDERIGTVIE